MSDTAPTAGYVSAATIALTPDAPPAISTNKTEARKQLADAAADNWIAEAAATLSQTSGEEGEPAATESPSETTEEKPEESKPEEKPAEPASDIDAIMRTAHEAAVAERQRRTSRAKWEQEKREFESRKAEVDSSMALLTRIKTGDLEALKEAGVSFEQLQQAALMGDLAPQVTTIAQRLEALEKQTKERESQMQAQQERAARQQAVESYTRDVRAAVEAHPKLGKISDHAVARAIQIAEVYGQRTGQLVDVASLVEYTASKVIEEARTLASVLEDSPSAAAVSTPAKRSSAAVGASAQANVVDLHGDDWIAQAARMLTSG